MAATFSGLSQSIWPTALGLLIGLISLWCYRYLSCTLGTFDREMECASLELTNQLTRYRGTWTTQFTPKADTDRSIFAACHSESWRYSMPVTTVALVLAWFLEAARSFYLDSLPLALVLWPALKYVGLIFALSCAPAQLLWVRVLHHRHDLRLVMASALCLAWCVADLAFDVHLL
jgi:hypothetical protein